MNAKILMGNFGPGRLRIARICSKCGVMKSLISFCREKKGALGRKAICRKCMGEYNKEYRGQHPDSGRAASYRYWLKNSEKIRAKHRKKYREKVLNT